MADLFYLILAYAFFWLLSFGLIFSIFSRQRKLDEEITMLKTLLNNQPER